METTLSGVMGMSDLMHAMRVETRRIMAAADGDLVVEHELILDRLVDAGAVRRSECEHLLTIFRHVHEAGEGKHDPATAYLAVRSTYDRLAGDPQVSPVAVIVAGAGLGSFQLEAAGDAGGGGSLGVSVARVSNGQQLSGIGAAIGVILGGVAGGVLGGAIGGYIGGMLDDKKDKKKT